MSLGILEYSDSAKAGGIVLRSASGTAPRVTLQSEPNDAHPPPLLSPPITQVPAKVLCQVGSLSPKYGPQGKGD